MVWRGNGRKRSGVECSPFIHITQSVSIGGDTALPALRNTNGPGRAPQSRVKGPFGNRDEQEVRLDLFFENGTTCPVFTLEVLSRIRLIAASAGEKAEEVHYS